MGLYQKKPMSQSFTLFMNTIQQYVHPSFSLEKKYKEDTKTETRGLQNNLKFIWIQKTTLHQSCNHDINKKVSKALDTGKFL